MSTLETITALIFLPSSIVAGVVFILRKFFEQSLARDLERYGANLKAEFEHSRLRLENDLQTKFFEFQTKFSLYHQKQAEVIEELYVMLCETEWTVSGLVSPVQGNDKRSVKERVAEADEMFVALARFFGKKRIYLANDVCQKMDTILNAMRKSVVQFSVGQMEPSGTVSDMRMWAEAWKVMDEEFPPLKEALEHQFREILSALPNSAAPRVISPDRPQLASNEHTVGASVLPPSGSR
ncbi:MAG: hypothetical protein JOZ02_14785 [Acidobacteria bacterium]|nr:hypothetical protein [Acidobacteriota bacterium]